MIKKACVDFEQRASVVIHPGCGGSARNWKPERYRVLCQILMENDLSVIVTGSDAERGLAAEVIGREGDRAISVAGTTGLNQLAALLQQASVFVGPSTGPMHLAAAVGTPVVALFGPVRNTGPDRWGPLGNGHKVFQPPVDTCKCRIGHCQLGDCMDMIPVEDVATAVLNAVRKRALQPQTNSGDLPKRTSRT
ncbi:MAG: glycosyltransferase family 9 protein [candidate division Zixibacteria bacterium]|nr:glycosyltransferase family 9 protein [candidate division Zixibacteria bacterium]